MTTPYTADVADKSKDSCVADRSYCWNMMSETVMDLCDDMYKLIVSVIRLLKLQGFLCYLLALGDCPKAKGNPQTKGK